MPITFFVDSGASISIIDENIYAKLKVRSNLSKAPSQLFAYGSKTADDTWSVRSRVRDATKGHGRPCVRCQGLAWFIVQLQMLTVGLVHVAKGEDDSLLS